MRRTYLILLALMLSAPLAAQEMTDDDRIKQMERRLAEECLVQSGSNELCSCIITDIKKNMIAKEYRFVMLTGHYTLNFAIDDVDKAYTRFGYTLGDHQSILNRLKAIEDAAEERCEPLHPITPSPSDDTKP